MLGLVAACLSFGGAYTATPFIQVEAVLKGAWLSQRVFIDCFAIGNTLPTPLVISATFVRIQGDLVDDDLGNALAGTVIITLGMFFPCFVFTTASHKQLERLVRNKACLRCLATIQFLIHHSSSRVSKDRPVKKRRAHIKSL